MEAGEGNGGPNEGGGGGSNRQQKEDGPEECWEGVGWSFFLLRTALQTMELSLKNSFGQSHTQRLARLKALRQLLGHSMPSERYLFLRTKIRMA